MSLVPAPPVCSTSAASRPDAPPALVSPAFKAALAETRALSRDATPAQIAKARHWAGADSGNQTPPETLLAR